MNLRKEKAAKLKIHVLDQTLKAVGVKSFADLYVDELCKKVKISKVTFFKYFPQKEDLLLYYLRIWCLHRSVELKQKPKEGLQGIYYLFEKMAEEMEMRQGVLLSLLSYLSDMGRSIKPFPVKPEEKKLLYPNETAINQIEIQSIEQLLERFVLEAILKKEITKTTATRDITNLLTANLWGSILICYTAQQSPPKIFFKRYLDWTLNGIC
jgi:AcrR family transcriptional regulator